MHDLRSLEDSDERRNLPTIFQTEDDTGFTELALEAHRELMHYGLPADSRNILNRMILILRMEKMFEILRSDDGAECEGRARFVHKGLIEQKMPYDPATVFLMTRRNMQETGLIFEDMNSLPTEAHREACDVASDSAGLIRQSNETFTNELAQLLLDHSGEWVAYHGKARLGFGVEKSLLLQRCILHGYPDEEIFIAKVQPRMGIADVTW